MSGTDHLMTMLQENGEGTIMGITVAALTVAIEDLGLSPLEVFVVGRAIVATPVPGYDAS